MRLSLLVVTRYQNVKGVAFGADSGTVALALLLRRFMPIPESVKTFKA
jgi:aconitase B